MNVPYQFLLGCTTAQVHLRAARALAQEVVWPVEKSFELLVRRVICLFFENPDLEAVTVTSWVQPKLHEDELVQSVQFSQSLKLTLLGCEVFASLDEKLDFLAENAPLHCMGNGTFTLRRDDRHVHQIMADPIGEDAAAICSQLAVRASESFKTLKMEITGGVALG